MSFFGSKSQPVKVGDQYIKSGYPHDVWEVSRVWEASDGVLHARLVNIKNPSESKAISISVLEDINFFIAI